MADELYGIVQGLLGPETQKEIAASNPYYKFVDIGPTVANTMLSAYANRKTPVTDTDIQDLAILSALSGLTSGIFQGFGDDYQATLSNRYLDAANKLMSNEPITAGGAGLNEKLFESAGRQAQLYKKIGAIQQAEDIRALKQAGAVAAAQAGGRVSGELGAYEALGGTGEGGASLLNPIEKAKIDVEDYATSAVKTAPIAAQYTDVKTNFQSMLKNYGKNDRAAALTFIMNFARVQDPGSVVRDQERHAVEQVAPYIAGGAERVKSIFTGESQLRIEDKTAMIKAASAKYDIFGKTYQDYVNSMRSVVAERGGNADRVVGILGYEPFDFTDWYKKHAGIETTIEEEMKGLGVSPAKATGPQLDEAKRKAINEAAAAALRKRGIEF